MTELYLSRARLTTSHERLGPLLFPDDPSRRVAASHRLVWTLFSADQKDRPFLYREETNSLAAGRAARGAFFVLSREKPGDGGGLFHVETKRFQPRLAAGDRLSFSLRANPTVQTSKVENGRRVASRHDVVMHAIHKVARPQRNAARAGAVRAAGLAWLERQAGEGGFRLHDPERVTIDGYAQVLVDPEGRRRGKRAVHSRLDFSGELEVTDPDVFLARLATGFGRARSFGNGLMLIRRPRGD